MLALLILLGAGTPTVAQERESIGGTRCLFAGHSFFIPVALKFDNFAKQIAAPAMMLEVSALVWLEILYGADTRQVDLAAYQSDIVGLVSKVVKHNEPNN